LSDSKALKLALMVMANQTSLDSLKSSAIRQFYRTNELEFFQNNLRKENETQTELKFCMTDSKCQGVLRASKQLVFKIETFLSKPTTSINTTTFLKRGDLFAVFAPFVGTSFSRKLAFLFSTSSTSKKIIIQKLKNKSPPYRGAL
jgi:hypothetical protein